MKAMETGKVRRSWESEVLTVMIQDCWLCTAIDDAMIGDDDKQQDEKIMVIEISYLTITPIQW